MFLSFVSQRRPSSWTLSVLSCFAILASYSAAAEPDNGLTDFSASWQPVVPLAGVKPLFGYQEKTVDKRQTECSANGSNYCFADNTVDYCGSCGICCGSDSSKYCCGTDQICCGSACCASGQTCENGQCFAAGGTVIVTEATQVTVSHTATQVVTVVQAVVETSTIFSTTSVTVSNEATQTDTEYVTVTANAKRDQVLVIVEVRQSDPGPGLRDTLSHFYKRFSLPWSDTEGLQRRDEIAPGDLGTPVSSGITTTTSITQTRDVTSFIPTTTTVPTTSVILTTIIQTKTVAVNAQTTVTTTSTLTVTSRPPTTETITQTQTLPTDSSSTTGPSSSPSSTSPGTSSPPSTKSSSLSTGAIAGIAGGIGGAALLALLALIIFCLRRRRNRPPPHQDPSSYLEPYEPDMSAPLPPPNRVSGSGLDRFSPSAPHHGTSPPPIAGALGTPDRYANMKPTDRYSGISSHTATTSRDGAVSPRLPDMAEVPGQERKVYEADSRSAAPKAVEMDGTSAPRAAEMDGTDHHPGASEMDGTGRHPTGAELGGNETISPVSPPQRYANYSPAHMEEMEGDDGSPNTLRNSNVYRQPGAYRDF